MHTEIQFKGLNYSANMIKLLDIMSRKLKFKSTGPSHLNSVLTGTDKSHIIRCTMTYSDSLGDVTVESESESVFIAYRSSLVKIESKLKHKSRDTSYARVS